MIPPTVAPPVQARSKRSYHRFLDATVELLAERPFDRIGVDEICARAGYTKGAFYHRFGDKATLLRDLMAHLTDGAVQAWDEFLAPERWASAPLRDVLDAFVRRVVSIYTRRPHLMRAFYVEAQRDASDDVRRTAVALNRRIADGLTGLVRAHRAELRPDVRGDPDAAVGFWLAALLGLLRASLWPDEGLGGGAQDAGQLEARALALLLPYLVEPGAGLPDL